MRFLFVFISLCFLYSCADFSGETYKKLSVSRTGIDFFNELTENDTLNYTIFPYMYMGGGISVGDINNDGLDDIFFTGNLIPNRLYLNKGNMRFEDISEKAGVMGNHQWFTGSTMADVNNDGWLDIYVCVSAKYQPSDNLLFINNKDNTFTESGKSYGINDKSSSVQATFFDYDNDGFLDLYVANYPIVLVSQGAEFYNLKIKENKFEESGHLYRNNGNKTFTDVTDEAGVRNFGMSIGVVAMDFNNDGWKDLYVSNDFNPPDYFYLNNGDGTFREVVKEATAQTSIFGMGFDAADINNDGFLDLYQIDMTPPEHSRRVLNVIPMRQETFEKSIGFGFHYQYMQNALQLNNGTFDSIPAFSNITLFANTAYTDWSWGGLFMDMDNDGLKDLFVSTGVLKDINNQDILSEPRSGMYFETGKEKEYRPELFPSTPVKNFVYRNNGDFTFTNKADEWGFKDPSLTNGLSYGDFDNDGDLDIVVHNVNEVSSVYENKTVKKDHHYIKIKLNGAENNRFGLGSIVTIKTGETLQKQELTLTRGYQSSVPPVIHFGTGINTIIDELEITWPDGRKQILTTIKTDQTLVLNHNEAVAMADSIVPQVYKFKDIAAQSGIHFLHKENRYNDFEHEPLLPYKYSHLGPGLAIGDVNGDGLEDFFVGNAQGSPGALFMQNAEGRFTEHSGPWIADSVYEDTGVLIFDADGDGLQDILVVSGGNNKTKNNHFNHRLYLNSCKGLFKVTQAIPGDLNQSGMCIKAADYDSDGDTDIFIGGRIVPGNYPVAANSYILRNNGGKGSNLRFENITPEAAPDLLNAGLVTDALWEDFDNDGDVDLIFTGEWMNLRFMENNAGKFAEVTDKLGFTNTCGWWYSLYSADIDQDGDRDIIAGNLGLNYRYNVKNNEVFEVYFNDFDVNGNSDIVLAYSEHGIKYPANSYTATTRQIPVIMQRYQTVESFANATLEDIYGIKMLESSLHYAVNIFTSVWLENQGNGSYKTHNLPEMAQFSSINAIEEIIYNNHPAWIIAGNLYNTEVETPRNDASIGLIMKYDKGKLKAVVPSESRLMIRGEVKALKTIKLANGKSALLVANNNEKLKLLDSGSTQIIQKNIAGK
jgi:hypothetical protein